MNFLFAFLVTIHVIVSLFLIIVVLLQSGKSADVAAAFGGQGSQTAFGPRGTATVLTRATTVSAVVFMLTSISLSIMAFRQQPGGRSVMGGTKTTTTAPAPAKPAQTPPQPEPKPVTGK